MSKTATKITPEPAAAMAAILRTGRTYREWRRGGARIAVRRITPATTTTPARD